MTYGSPAWRPWVLDEEASRPFFRQALEAGINFFDTADMYSDGASEEVIGRALKDFARREDVVVATKVFNPMGPGRTTAACRASTSSTRSTPRCAGCQMDYVDLYQIHRFDPETPIEETLRALDDVVRAGKVRYLGASSTDAWRFAKALFTADRRGWSRFVSMQNHYNLVYREEEREMLPLCRAEGIGVIPWSPLARGLLAGTRRPGQGGTASAPGRTISPEASTTTRTSTSSTVSSKSPASAACRRRRSRWRGSWRSRASPRRSSARASRSTSRRPSPPWA